MLLLALRGAAATGITCVGCGLILSLTLERDAHSSEPSDVFLAKLCDSNALCEEAAAAVTVSVRSGIDTPDTVCKVLGLCKTGCSLFSAGGWPPKPLPTPPPRDPSKWSERRLEKLVGMASLSAGATNALASALERTLGVVAPSGDGYSDLVAVLGDLFSTLQGGASQAARLAAAASAVAPLLEASHPCAALNVSCLIDRFEALHLPVSDRDGDAFASTDHRGLRGSHWRGADCDDTKVEVYPGRATSSTASAAVDHDCNGIHGVDPSGRAYEEMLCASTPRRGLIILGDSATAHFHLPPGWLTHRGWGLKHMDVVPDAMDELDWPACSWGTGYRNVSSCPPTVDPGRAAGKSLAARLRERNRCNHRDFQNIGVNGARSTSALALAQSAARAIATDHPALVVISLIGNDVCNGHPWTSHMTPPETFRAKVTAMLDTLATKLPTGSFVLLVGLVDGRVLWNATHAQQHPIGATYPEIYQYLTCNECSPCNGWMTENATFRDVTSAWAMRLSAVHREIAARANYSNFEVGFVQPDFGGWFRQYAAGGGDPMDLIEPSDGFHPDQLLQAIIAEQLWLHLEREHPDALGPVNPHNAEIQRLFGDQGGF